MKSFVLPTTVLALSTAVQATYWSPPAFCSKLSPFTNYFKSDPTVTKFCSQYLHISTVTSTSTSTVSATPLTSQTVETVYTSTQTNIVTTFTTTTDTSYTTTTSTSTVSCAPEQKRSFREGKRGGYSQPPVYSQPSKSTTRPCQTPAKTTPVKTTTTPVYHAPTTKSVYVPPTTKSVYASPTTKSVYVPPTTKSVHASPTTGYATPTYFGGVLPTIISSACSCLSLTTPTSTVTSVTTVGLGQTTVSTSYYNTVTTTTSTSTSTVGTVSTSTVSTTVTVTRPNTYQGTGVSDAGVVYDEYSGVDLPGSDIGQCTCIDGQPCTLVDGNSQPIGTFATCSSLRSCENICDMYNSAGSADGACRAVEYNDGSGNGDGIPRCYLKTGADGCGGARSFLSLAIMRSN